MSQYDESASKVAEFLLQIKAIQIRPDNPFTWASGWKSPFYCDNRKTLSYPNIRTYLRQHFVNIITNEFSMPDVIAGVATGGIAMGALVAQEMGLPFVYVRSSEKNHGLGNQIEGNINEGQSVIVIEDLVSTGASSLAAVEALRKAGCKVIGMVSIFSYNFPVAEENFKKADCPLFSLTNYKTLIKQALESDYITDKQVKVLEKWRQNPDKWDIKK
ncbi:MAG: orotate phosphoribosyltransferase [Bacteroidota bacterium]|nr:orotate phosphoribosyltransferase [Bacteroidota bacterium]